MTYLVTGATGKAGRQVVSALLAGGHRVRALTRDPAKATFPTGVEVVAGDLTKPSSVPFDGVVGVHLITVGGDDYAPLDTGPELADLARKAGVGRVAVLWNGQPGPVEAAIEASGLGWTWLQANDFMGPDPRHSRPGSGSRSSVRRSGESCGSSSSPRRRRANVGGSYFLDD